MLNIFRVDLKSQLLAAGHIAIALKTENPITVSLFFFERRCCLVRPRDFLFLNRSAMANLPCKKRLQPRLNVQIYVQ